jgi:hypothetical protein
MGDPRLQVNTSVRQIQNPKPESNRKFEARNPKEIQKKKLRMTKTKELRSRPGFDLDFEHWNFGIVSDFEFRASDFCP